MTVLDQTLLDSLAKIIPLLTPLQKEKLLSFGEGMATANREQAQRADQFPPVDKNEN